MSQSAAGTDPGKTYQRMVKCLELTASDNDAEALLAIRKANELRSKLGLAWGAPLPPPKGATAPPPDPEPEEDPPEPNGDYDYEAVFAFIFAHGMQGPKWTGILKSIEEYWHSVGKLSPKQHNLVMKFYQSAQEART
jgi:hypothetical protein